MWKSECTAFMASPHQTSVSRHIQAIAAVPPANSPHHPLSLLLVLYLFVMEHVRTLKNVSFAATKIPVYTAI